MRWMIFTLLVAVFWPASVQAQNESLDIVQQPICFAVVNTANHMVNGSFATDYYFRPADDKAPATKAKHRSNFRLQAKGSIDERTGKPNDRAEFCSYGPFLPNRMLTLTLRALFPVFECRTRVDTGQEIIIKSERRADDTGVQTWAECFRADGTKTGKPGIVSNEDALERAF